MIVVGCHPHDAAKDGTPLPTKPSETGSHPGKRPWGRDKIGGLALTLVSSLGVILNQPPCGLKSSARYVPLLQGGIQGGNRVLAGGEESLDAEKRISHRSKHVAMLQVGCFAALSMIVGAWQVGV